MLYLRAQKSDARKDGLQLNVLDGIKKSLVVQNMLIIF
jgi:hypothetical protein